MWYNLQGLLSHNALFNFVIGNRGGGKTFECKRWCISDYLKNGNTFVWVRRYKNEMKKMDRFFDDIRFKFPGVKLEVKGSKCYCNDTIFGEFITLSTSSQEKSVPFPTVNKIIYDEFLIDKGTFRYLKNEVDVFLELYETVARLRDNVRAIFLGNAITSINPYFLYWNIKPDLSKRFNKKGMVLIELFKDQDFITAKNKTRFGQLIANTNYGQYAINNNMLRDNETFIEYKTKESEFILSINYNNYTYGFWVDYKKGLIYVSDKHDPYTYMNFSVTKEDHDINTLLIRSLSNSKPMQQIVFAFEQGLIRFENQQIKNQFYEYITHFIRC